MHEYLFCRSRRSDVIFVLWRRWLKSYFPHLLPCLEGFLTTELHITLCSTKGFRENRRPEVCIFLIGVNWVISKRMDTGKPFHILRLTTPAWQRLLLESRITPHAILLKLHSKQGSLVSRPPFGTSSDMTYMTYRSSAYCTIGLPLIKRGNQLRWQRITLRFQTLRTRSVTKEGVKRKSHACKQHPACVRRLKVRQTCNLHTAVQLRGDFTSVVRVVSEQTHTSVLREGSRLSAVSKFVNLHVSDLYHSWLPILTTLFRTFVAVSDESERDHADGQHSPTVQITLSSIKLRLSLREADVCHASWNDTSTVSAWTWRLRSTSANQCT
jgi:hypothetical protein